MNESPYFLVFGRDPVFPVDAFLKDKVTPLYNFSDYKYFMVNRLEEAYKVAKGSLEKAFKSQKSYFDRNLKSVEIRVGDKVLLHRPVSKKGITRKLSREWTGPFRVVKKFTPVDFEIKKIDGFETHRVHQNRLKLAKS